MYSGIIYKATNLSNGKVYIGKTTRSLEERKRVHAHPQGIVSWFDHQISEKGLDAFKWEIIDKMTTNSHQELTMFLSIAEDYHIAKCRSYDPRKGYNTERVHKKRVFHAREDAPADETRVTEGIVFASGQARPIALYSTEGEFIKYYPSMQHERMLALSDKHLHIREPYCKLESGCNWKGIILHLRPKEYPPKQIRVEHQ